METQMGALLFLSAMGIMSAIFAVPCMSRYVKERPEDALLFGKIHWSIIGVIGYLLIAATAMMEIPLALYTLVSITGLVTIWLIVIKAIMARILCLICMFMWGLNIAIVVVTFSPPG